MGLLVGETNPAKLAKTAVNDIGWDVDNESFDNVAMVVKDIAEYQISLTSVEEFIQLMCENGDFVVFFNPDSDKIECMIANDFIKTKHYINSGCYKKEIE